MGRMDLIKSNALFDSLCEHLFGYLSDSIARRKMEVSRKGEDGRTGVRLVERWTRLLVDIF